MTTNNDRSFSPPQSDRSSQLHVVVGAGATGAATAQLLAQQGSDVIVVSRSGSGPTASNIRLIAADATDCEQLTTIATGATAIYNCANPAYHQWTTDWPPLADAMLGAATATGAVLVTLSNLYGYANPTAPMRASDPLNPSSIKGGVRATMWHAAKAAHDAGQVRVTEARASDFIGPNVGASGHMGDRVIPRVLRGKSVSLLGDIDATHSWTAISDVARTLVTIATDERAWGRAWHVPTPAPLSQRALVHHICELAGVDVVKVSSIPALAVRALGLVMPAMRELREVAYQFDAPFIIDSQATSDVFGLMPTPLDETLLATLESYGHSRESDVLVRR